MYMVKKAIILAAGKGTRLTPLTLVTPKPLIEVNGCPIIERTIKKIHENGIRQIYIIVGYMKEKFMYLQQKYENINFIDNPYYDQANNISSLYVAREHIAESIIIEGDLIIHNSDILKRDFEKSDYNCMFVESGRPKEWGIKIEKDSIVNCDKSGGHNDWQLFGISRWNKEDGERLKQHIEKEFEKDNNSQIYWDDIPLFNYFSEYDLGIIEMNEKDLVEIDTFEDLVKIDGTYKNAMIRY